MNLAEKQRTVRALAKRLKNGAEPPSGVVDLIIYHMLHLHLPLKAAEAGFKRLKRNFVDWNEVRVSAAREIAAVLGNSKCSLELAERIRGFLQRVHSDRHDTSLECLNEMTIAEARRYLRSFGALSTATIDLVLRLKKSQSTVPLDKESERVIVRVGLVPARWTVRQKQKVLDKLVPDGELLQFHRSVVDLARSVCREREDQLRCMECPLRRGCSFRRKIGRRNGSRSRRKRR